VDVCIRDVPAVACVLLSTAAQLVLFSIFNVREPLLSMYCSESVRGALGKSEHLRACTVFSSRDVAQQCVLAAC